MKTDGRYVGGTEELSIVLRVDLGGSGVLSADVSRGLTYLASVRTAPGVKVDAPHGRWPAQWQDVPGATATGTIAVAAVPAHPEQLAVTLHLDHSLNGLPPADYPGTVARQGDDVRDLGVEVDLESGVRAPAPVDFQGAPMDLGSCLRSAGFATTVTAAPSPVPAPPEPWDYSTIFSVLNDLMTDLSGPAGLVPAWKLHLLLLSRCSRPSLAGIMFDQTWPLPRQGSAVFVDTIRELVKDDDEDRQILRTAVHELGHALNLAHRFERAVGRADSTSFMNYPQRYLRGGHVEDYWTRFAYTFDADELEFLRHGPRGAVRPGDAAFHSVRYWRDTGGGYVPYLPEVPQTGMRLALVPPQNGPLFAYGQPVLLGVTLQNVGDTAVQFPSNPLDPKTGGLELLIRRVTGTTDDRSFADASPFVPLMQACELEDESTEVTLAPGGTLSNNVNLTFGSGGFAFAEPGTYQVLPLLSRPTAGPPDTDQLVVGEVLRIRIGYPKDVGDEHDALVLSRPDVGTYFALGGSDCLTRAEDDLMAVYERRSAVNGPADPVATAIARAAGINAGRHFVRVRNGAFAQRPADPGRAAALLGGLDAAALGNFDPQTAQSTARLARRYQGNG
ncbi:hypothetical protein ACFO1B_12855 [Dactylosporangium siamense]|uniref:hypothetical protein n=1 Tax=Dactylosporangium siamense TaxID=685454 RepID=UPI001941E420|nr:hypothetical protein [Dactylosporangium siamense]